MDGNPEHKRRYAQFVNEMRDWLQAERGRASRLARYLGVPRQSVSRWFVTTWAALTSNVWYHEQKSLEENLIKAPRREVLSADPATNLQKKSRELEERLSTWGATRPAQTSRQLAFAGGEQ